MKLRTFLQGAMLLGVPILVLGLTVWAHEMAHTAIYVSAGCDNITTRVTTAQGMSGIFTSADCFITPKEKKSLLDRQAMVEATAYPLEVGITAIVFLLTAILIKRDREK